MADRLAAILLAVVAALGLALFADSLGRPLANPDDARYPEIAREMAASGEWLTPRLNGIKYFEKPPLLYWATAASLATFGVTEHAARLYVALCALLTLLVVGYTAARLDGRRYGWAAAAVLASSPYFLALGSTVTLDMGLTLWTTLTLCAFMLAERREAGPHGRRRWMLVAWAAMALAVLSKGLVGVVFPAAALILHCLVQRDFSVLRRMEWGYGIVVFTAIAAPWFVAVSYAHPEFAEFFFIHEHFDRFLTPSHQRGAPGWYFLAVLAAAWIPWTFVLPSALVHGWRNGAYSRSTPAMRLAILWSAFIVAFFSASSSKLPMYILPAFPALALVLGRYVVEAPARKLAMQVGPMALVAIVLAIVAWRAPEAAREEWLRTLRLEAQPWVMAAAAALAGVALSGARLFTSGRRGLAVATVAVGMLVVFDCAMRAYEGFLPRQSAWLAAGKARPYLRPDTRLYSVGIYDQSLPFYLERTLMLVEYRDEFATGLRSEPQRQLGTLDEFVAHWLRPGEAMAIIHPEIYDSLRDEGLGLPMQLIHQDPRRVLVRKP